MSPDSVQRFPARELTPYAEPVVLEKLITGNIYFAVQYSDRDLLIPIVRPLVYLGRNLDGASADIFYFQDFESFTEGVRYERDFESKQDHFEVCDLNGGAYIFEFEKALEELMKCGSRRGEAGSSSETE